MNGRRINVHAVTVALLSLSLAASGQAHTDLVNGGFEAAEQSGTPSGWMVVHGLDPHGYGSPDYELRFDAIRPTQGAGGFRSDHGLAFPAEGVWRCPVYGHGNADGANIDGKQLGKAAVCQTVDLPPGRYRFSAMLRTAEGHLYSAAFSLGVSQGAHAEYADDDSTGIRWTRTDLGMKRDELRAPVDRGDWARYATEPFVLDEAGPVTVWIRFNYANENQMDARWQADGARIERVEDDAEQQTIATPQVCPPPREAERYRVLCGADEPYLAGAGTSELVDASRVRLFRRARLIPPQSGVSYRFPEPQTLDGLSLLAATSGPATILVGDRSLPAPAAESEFPTTREWPIPADAIGPEGLQVTVRAGEEPVRLFELELSAPSRTIIRCLNVPADAIRVLWTVGAWDAAAREFEAGGGALPEGLAADALPPSGTWRLQLDHDPTPGHRYVLLHGFLKERGTIDIGDDGLVEWTMETEGEEITDLDVTEMLRTGSNTIALTASDGHDFAALVEVCPGSSDPSSYQLFFEGDELAERFTRVAANTWFWLRELHYEPTGFVDASVPRGKWYSQYWPIDIAAALREWVRWGYQEESVRVGLLASEIGWSGHSSNRSGGSDNTGGNILARELCEIIHRADFDPDVADPLWERIRTHAEQVIANAEASPFGLVKGTNWENAGNREHGPCYALSTTLGAAASLRAGAVVAERRGSEELGRSWRAAADAMRAAVLEHLVIEADHACPSGFVLPTGTWAYGLRGDGAIEDQPLAGYFWAATADVDASGTVNGRDRELLEIYSRTLTAAMPLLGDGTLRGRRIVSGYALSYDGPAALLCAAVLCDRFDTFEVLLRGMDLSTDAVEDRGSEFAELSRWAYGGPRTTEDTNLVVAGNWLQALRMMLGIDDVLAGGAQFALAPRLPAQWTAMGVNGWRVRCRDDGGTPRWTRLWFRFERDGETYEIHLRTSDTVRDAEVRLGPLPRECRAVVTDLPAGAELLRLESSGDAAWAWIRCTSGPEWTALRVTPPAESP